MVIVSLHANWQCLIWDWRSATLKLYDATEHLNISTCSGSWWRKKCYHAHGACLLRSSLSRLGVGTLLFSHMLILVCLLLNTRIKTNFPQEPDACLSVLAFRFASLHWRNSINNKEWSVSSLKHTEANLQSFNQIYSQTCQRLTLWANLAVNPINAHT